MWSPPFHVTEMVIAVATIELGTATASTATTTISPPTESLELLCKKTRRDAWSSFCARDSRDKSASGGRETAPDVMRGSHRDSLYVCVMQDQHAPNSMTCCRVDAAKLSIRLVIISNRLTLYNAAGRALSEWTLHFKDVVALHCDDSHDKTHD